MIFHSPVSGATSMDTTPSKSGNCARRARPMLTSLRSPAQRALDTENVADFAAEQDVVLVCVLKRNLPAGVCPTHALATVVDRWASDNPRPVLAKWQRLEEAERRARDEAAEEYLRREGLLP